MSIKYLISFKSGDKKLVDRLFYLNEHIYCLTVNKLTDVERLEGMSETTVFSCHESNIEYVEELPELKKYMVKKERDVITINYDGYTLVLDEDAAIDIYRELGIILDGGGHIEY